VGEESGGSEMKNTISCNDNGSPIQLDDSRPDEGVGALMWGLIGFFLGCVVMVFILFAVLN